MKISFLPFIGVFLGVFIALQGVINALLGKMLTHPLQATMVNFLVGGLLVLILLQVMGIGWPSFDVLKKPHPALFFGGVLGVIFVTGVLLLVPKIGVANVIMATFVGQIVASLLFDHFGFFGLPRIPLDWSRIIGALLMVAGLYVVQSRTG